MSGLRARMGHAVRRRLVLLGRARSAHPPARPRCARARFRLRLARERRARTERRAPGGLPRAHRDMTDLLRDLVGRTLGVRDVVRPRPGAAFEPDRLAPTGRPIEAAEIEDLD